MALEGVYEVAGVCIPEFAGSVVAACNKFVSIFVEAAVGQWKNMAF